MKGKRQCDSDLGAIQSQMNGNTIWFGNSWGQAHSNVSANCLRMRLGTLVEDASKAECIRWDEAVTCATTRATDTHQA